MKKNGFTLVELAISLLVISILTYGILASLKMLKQAQVRAIIDEAQQFIQAINTFEDKYHSLPGDMYNAYEVFGAACTGSAANCNGNGDGHINSDETYKAWLHLKLADMLSGQYTGLIGTGAKIGVNIPGSRYRANSGWGFGYSEAYSPPSGYGQYLALSTADTNFPSSSAVLPEDAQIIDQKMDDGLPKNGLIMGYGLANATNGCYTNDSISAIYSSTLQDYNCVIRFIFRRY